ncbi:MAG: hypothetical protein AABW50_02555 [Nanoarchaeota archaeon]
MTFIGIEILGYKLGLFIGKDKGAINTVRYEMNYNYFNLEDNKLDLIS